MSTLVGDFFDDALSLDSRVARTVTRLIFSPGRLTRAYFDGQRVRYMPPFRLFLVCSLLFFASVNLSGLHILRIVMSEVPIDEETRAQALATINEKSTGALKDKLTSTITATNAAAYYATLSVFTPATEPVKGGLRTETIDKLLEEPDVPDLLRRLVRSSQRAITEPEAFNAQLNLWLPRMMFILVPVFALVIRLFYWRQGLYFAHHVFFALHFHCFVFVLLTLLIALVPAYGGEAGAWIFMVGSGGYLLWSMKTAYTQSWLVTIGKWFAITLMYTVVFSAILAFTLLVAIQRL